MPKQSFEWKLLNSEKGFGLNMDPGQEGTSIQPTDVLWSWNVKL